MEQHTLRQIVLVSICPIIDFLFISYYTVINRIKIWVWGGRTGQGFRSTGPLFLRNRGKIVIGRFFRFNSGRRINIVGGEKTLAIWVGREGSLLIGDSVGISSSTIVCLEKITIGDNVFIGGGCEIYDTDFHHLKATERSQKSLNPPCGPISIERDVFIGAGTTILKGVTIGEGAVIGAKSLVTKNVPPREVWGGVPAKRLRELPR